jgi:hypothetical protein
MTSAPNPPSARPSRADGGPVGASPQPGPGHPRPFAVGDLARFLVGRWTIEREIAGHQQGPTRFSGSARITHTDGGDLEYAEIGMLTIGAAPLEAGRRLSLHLVSQASAEVRFADGTPFRLLDLSAGWWRVHLACADDRYRGRFLARSNDELAVRWHVEGPRKQYVSSSRYTRCTGAQFVPSPSSREVAHGN